MKFGQELRKKWTHEWATEYLDYSGLKSNLINYPIFNILDHMIQTRLFGMLLNFEKIRIVFLEKLEKTQREGLINDAFILEEMETDTRLDETFT